MAFCVGNIVYLNLELLAIQIINVKNSFFFIASALVWYTVMSFLFQKWAGKNALDEDINDRELYSPQDLINWLKKTDAKNR
jgi:hypothetical protein